MNARNAEGLYGALEEALRQSKDPLECATLFDMPSIREHAETVNRVSDYLGNMWRKGQVLRLPAPKLEGTRARWMYMLKPRVKTKPVIDMEKAVEFRPRVGALLTRPHLEITEEGQAIVITMKGLSITIRQT